MKMGLKWLLVLALFFTTVSPSFAATSKFISVAAGWDHSLALNEDGTVWAWGQNTYGQLGDGTTTQRLTPVPVSGLSKVAAIAAGYNHSLTLKEDGTVWTWGQNTYGQLGDGTTTQRLTPVQVSGLTNVVTIAAGTYYSLAVKGDGTVWAWGNNTNGQLGDGTKTNRSTPVQVSGLTNVVKVAAGAEFAIAVKQDGTVWTWGNNNYGQLGDGSLSSGRTTPAQISGVTNVVGVSAGNGHVLVRKQDGTVWGWGQNAYGQLGDGTTTQRLTPVHISALTNVTAVFSGNIHSLARKQDGTLLAWGYNANSQLGNGTTTNRLTPVQVSGLTEVSDLANVAVVAGGVYHSLAVRLDGTIWAWGRNYDGQLGDGTITDRTAPVRVVIPLSSNPNATPNDYQKISVGETFQAFLKPDGTVWAWGSMSQTWGSQLWSSTTPVQLTGGYDVKQISAEGGQHIVALKKDGTVWAMGDNASGQLGNNSNQGSSSFVQVRNQDNTPFNLNVSGANYVEPRVWAGKQWTLARKSDGTVWGWGTVKYYYTGGNSGDIFYPVQLHGINRPIVSVNEFTVFMENGDSHVGFGSNNYGQLGNGMTGYPQTAVLAVQFPNAIKFDGGRLHTIALKKDGTVWAVGYNGSGQVDPSGVNTTTAKYVTSNVKDIAATNDYNMALRNDNTLYLWGSSYTSSGEIAAIPDILSININANGAWLVKTDGTLWRIGAGYKTAERISGVTLGSSLPPSITVGSSVIAEGAANDGSISTTQVVTLQNGNFVGDMSTGVTVNNLPTGLGFTVTRNSETQITIAFTGRASHHADVNDVANASITIDKSKIVGASVNVTSGTFRFDFNDPEPTVSLGKPVIREAAANDGSIEDRQVLTLVNGTFASTITGQDVTVNNLPAGLGIVVTRDSATQMSVSFTGKAAAHANANDVTNASISINKSKIVGATNNVTSGTFGFDFIDPEPTVSLGKPVIREAAANDGTIAEKQVLTLSNGSFASTITVQDVTVNNLPAGLGIDVTRDSATQLTISFTGKAAAHANANDVANTSITINKSKITGATANVTSPTFTFDFQDSEGQTVPTGDIDGLQITSSPTQVVVTFNNPEKKLTVGELWKGNQKLRSNSTKGNYLVLSGTEPNQSYLVKVEQEGGKKAEVPVSTPKDGETGAKAPAPLNFRVIEKTSTSIKLAWDPPVGSNTATQYELKGTRVSDNKETVFRRVRETSYLDRTIKQGESYTYELRTYQRGKQLSDPVTVTVKADGLYILEPPTNVRVSETAQSLLVQFDGKADKYLIEAYLGTEKKASVNTALRSWSVSKQPGNWRFVITGIKAGYQNSEPAIAEYTVAEKQQPPAGNTAPQVTNLRAQDDASGRVLKWDPPTNTDGVSYWIQRVKKSGGADEINRSVKTNSFVDKTFDAKETYVYSVITVKSGYANSQPVTLEVPARKS